MNSVGVADNPTPQVRSVDRSAPVEDASLAAQVFESIRDIRDPEHPNTLEELSVVDRGSVTVTERTPGSGLSWGTVSIAFTPTVPHCSLASLIGLSIRAKLDADGILSPAPSTVGALDGRPPSGGLLVAPPALWPMARARRQGRCRPRATTSWTCRWRPAPTRRQRKSPSSSMTRSGVRRRWRTPTCSGWSRGVCRPRW
eukprot:TRINITY_DN5269_c0_g1_i1.p2 TRINITY_DN5269_c0_g1~~TRINITY_DN5269_c0_g1_i1.p2  ORF type:complete len:199 (-),score=13.51 TRINITY_DN5269_c0_g1_i1:115-711(-)